MLKYFTIPLAAMGSSCEVKLYAHDSQSANVVAGAVVAEVKRLENRYSRYKKTTRYITLTG